MLILIIFSEFADSENINKRIIAMRKHFRAFPHWYDFEKIAKSCVLYLHMERVVEDEGIELIWDTWYQDFHFEPVDTLAAVALAMHTVIMEIFKKKGDHNTFLKKIFVR
jgi:hypothetical protein